jgi:hypothetical protein
MSIHASCLEHGVSLGGWTEHQPDGKHYDDDPHHSTQKATRSITLLIIRGIWKGRNDRVFNHRESLSLRTNDELVTFRHFVSGRLGAGAEPAGRAQSELGWAVTGIEFQTGCPTWARHEPEKAQHEAARPYQARCHFHVLSRRAIVPEWRRKHDTKETFSCRVVSYRVVSCLGMTATRQALRAIRRIVSC